MSRDYKIIFSNELQRLNNYLIEIKKQLESVKNKRIKELLLAKLEDGNRLKVNYKQVIYNSEYYIHIKYHYKNINNILDDVFTIIRESKSIEELVLRQDDVYDGIKDYVDQWKYYWKDDFSNNQPGIKLYGPPVSFDAWIDNASGGNCPKCGSPTQMRIGGYSIFFGCSEYAITGCKGKIKPNKRQLEEYCSQVAYWEWYDLEKGYECCLAMAFPDWNPDFETFDSYAEKNGIF